MIKINVLIENKSWIKYIKNPENYFKKKIKKLNNNIIFKNKKIEFSLLLSGSKIITKLNLKFRKKDKATDVLSFPSNELLNSKKRGKKSFIYILCYTLSVYVTVPPSLLYKCPTFFYNFLRQEFGHDFYMDLLMVSDLTDVINSQKYVRLFAKSEKSKVGKCIRIFIRFDHRLGMFFV